MSRWRLCFFHTRFCTNSVSLYLDFTTMKNSKQFILEMLFTKHILKLVFELISATLEPVKSFQIRFFRKSIRWSFCKITCVTFYIHLSLHGTEMVLCWTVDPHHMAFDPLECVFGSENLRSSGERSTAVQKCRWTQFCPLLLSSLSGYSNSPSWRCFYSENSEVADGIGATHSHHILYWVKVY